MLGFSVRKLLKVGLLYIYKTLFSIFKFNSGQQYIFTIKYKSLIKVQSVNFTDNYMTCIFLLKIH